MRESRERVRGDTRNYLEGADADEFVAKLGGLDSSSDSVNASPQEKAPAAASNLRGGGRNPDPAMSLEGGGGGRDSAGGGSSRDGAVAPAAPISEAAETEPAVTLQLVGLEDATCRRRHPDWSVGSRSFFDVKSRFHRLVRACLCCAGGLLERGVAVHASRRPYSGVLLSTPTRV